MQSLTPQPNLNLFLPNPTQSSLQSHRTSGPDKISVCTVLEMVLNRLQECTHMQHLVYLLIDFDEANNTILSVIFHLYPTFEILLFSFKRRQHKLGSACMLHQSEHNKGFLYFTEL